MHVDSAVKGIIVMQHNPIVWFEIYVNDMQRAIKFYEAVLQMKLQKLNSPTAELVEMWSFPSSMEAPGASGALAKMDGGPQPGSGTIVYFRCEDCATEAGRVPASGGSVMKEKFSIGEYGYIALVNDTEGNTIGFHSMK
jgi:predicted enzyme related to lactoylglutathione lyase